MAFRIRKFLKKLRRGHSHSSDSSHEHRHRATAKKVKKRLLHLTKKLLKIPKVLKKLRKIPKVLKKLRRRGSHLSDLSAQYQGRAKKMVRKTAMKMAKKVKKRMWPLAKKLLKIPKLLKRVRRRRSHLQDLAAQHGGRAKKMARKTAKKMAKKVKKRLWPLMKKLTPPSPRHPVFHDQPSAPPLPTYLDDHGREISTLPTYLDYHGREISTLPTYLDYHGREISTLPTYLDDDYGRFIKVEMQGRGNGLRVDLTRFQGYEELFRHLEQWFHIEAGQLSSSRLTEYEALYIDNDADYMMIGDHLSWRMFLRICRGIYIERRLPATEQVETTKDEASTSYHSLDDDFS